MENQKVIFRQAQYNEQGEYVGQKEFHGLILDKYRSMSDGIGGPHPSDYYLVEIDSGDILSILPHEIIKRIN